VEGVRNKRLSKTGIQGDNRCCCRKFIWRSASEGGVGGITGGVNGGITGGITGGTDDGIKEGIDRLADYIRNTLGRLSNKWVPSANNSDTEDLSKMFSGI